ncbi:MAG: SDR family oxidoreductase [Syntrophobacteraceae bacterium]|jgi:NAD(P)-dependent dehydrogenase (short-subunit alcohol dehydrogenase family)|nr:SDR family oxidoreductase [Syntrophobacteraceae bacterium]
MKLDAGTFLVVGGSSGIGFEIVVRLMEQNHEIYVGSRTNDRLTGFEGVRHVGIDVREPQSHLEGLPEVMNGLVYCPGTIRLKSFNRLTREDFLDDLQINFLGAVSLIQACLPNLRRSARGASIVLFSSVAVRTGMALHASIAAAKGAVEGLARSLAAEFAPHIRVNAIAPSLVDTPLAGDLLSSEEKRHAAAERHPLKRIGRPQDVADLAVFLLSDAAGWITGQVLHVDGGMSTLRIFK